MLLNFIYSLFFGLIDLIIFSLLTKNIKLPNYVLKIGIILLIIFIILNSFTIIKSVQYYQFDIILYFSLGLIILYFMSEFQIKILRKRVLQNSEISPRITERYFMVVDFIRLRVIYFMTYAFQLLAIWENLPMQ